MHTVLPGHIFPVELWVVPVVSVISPVLVLVIASDDSLPGPAPVAGLVDELVGELVVEAPVGAVSSVSPPPSVKQPPPLRAAPISSAAEPRARCR
jgi:hypothetical protein